MTNPLQTAHNRATAAIDALAREAERLANEHAFALDRLRQECESLRAQNAHLRERLAVLTRPDVQVVVTSPLAVPHDQPWRHEFHGVHDAPPGSQCADVASVDTDAT